MLGVSLHNLGVWFWWHVVARPIAETVESGAASVVYAALSPTLQGKGFAYVAHCRVATPSPAALNATAARILWRESERIVSEYGGRK